MKRFASLLLAAFIACSMFVISASATYVLSPEFTDIVDDPTPMAPGVIEEIEDVEIPLAPLPQSPQTGEAFNVAGVAVVAVLCGAAAVISTKKAAEFS